MPANEPLLFPGLWVDVLRELVPRAWEGAEPSAVHQLQIATRRLDVWLQLGGRARLRDDLRWLRRIAGPVHDLDVLIAKDWPAREARRLRSLRAVARKALREALRAPRLTGLLTALVVSPPIHRVDARARVRPFAAKVLALRPAEDDLEGLHHLRRVARRLRYALEWLEEPVGPLLPMQDALGTVHELAQAIEWLGPDAVPAEVLADRAGQARALAHESRRFVASWS